MRHTLLRVVMLSLVALAQSPALLAQGGPKNRIEPSSDPAYVHPGAIA